MSERRILLGALLCLAACPAADQDTRLLVTFERAADSPPPEFLLVTWTGEGAVLGTDRRVPDEGALPPDERLGTFDIGVRGAGAWRTIEARGWVGAAIVSEGAARVFAEPGAATPVTVRL